MAGKYCIGKADIDKQIEDLAKRYSQPGSAELMRHIITTSLKLYFDGANELDLRIINTSLKEMRHAFRVFAQYRDTRKVVIWGSARIKESSTEYKMAREFSKNISDRGFIVITGGGGGVMEAGNRGAGDKSFGINIDLPMEQGANPYVKGKKSMRFHYFFTRKLIFVKESDATVLFPGGFGTNDEAFEILTLAQTGKTTPRPIIFVEPKGSTYWRNWLKFMKRDMIGGGYISERDLNLFKVVSSVDMAVDEVVGFYKVFHSIRYVGPKTVLRLNKELNAGQVAKLNKEFSGILLDGSIEEVGPLRDEVMDKDCLDLPRLVMQFNRHDYGLLYKMIRKINSF
jgi:uncharacterized protein (TIGR00730 family)